MALTNLYTGANGALTLANENTPEGQDASAVIEAYEIQTVGRVTDVTVKVTTQLEEFHEIGRRHPTSLHPGNISISGTIGRAYINGSLLMLLLGRGAGPTNHAEPYVQPTFNMNISLGDPAVPGNSVTLEMKGVKFQNWTYNMPEDDFVMEDVTFKALTISAIDRDGSSGEGEAVAVNANFSDSNGSA